MNKSAALITNTGEASAPREAGRLAGRSEVFLGYCSTWSESERSPDILLHQQWRPGGWRQWWLTLQHFGTHARHFNVQSALPTTKHAARPLFFVNTCRNTKNTHTHTHTEVSATHCCRFRYCDWVWEIYYCIIRRTQFYLLLCTPKTLKSIEKL